MRKPKIIILGKLPPPFMGPAIATEIILKSKLNDSFELIHLDTKINDSIATMGRLSLKKMTKNFLLYVKMIYLLLRHWPSLVLIPISQSKGGYLKDAIYIFLSKLVGRKIILHLRGSAFRDLYESSSPSFQRLVRMTMNMSSGIIVLGKKLKPIFKDLIPEEQIFVVPNGGNYNLPEREPMKENVVRLLYLSNLMKEKGVTDVLKATVLLKKNEIPFTMNLAGAWLNQETKTECEALIKDNNLPVILYPPQDKKGKFELMTKADIFLFPPRSPEGHPWVLVESMACGLPIIATDQGAIIESVIDGENGYILPIESPELIFEKLKYLITNSDAREKMSKASRKLYEAGFTEDKMVENLERVFNKIIKNER